MIQVDEICTDVQLLNILVIFKNLISLLTILVPVILIIFVIIDIIKTISSGDVDTKKLSSSISKRVIAAFIIFLVPYLVNFVLNIVPTGGLYYLACYNNATSTKIATISTNNSLEALDDFEQKLSASENQVNQDNYGQAYLSYGVARNAIKLITDKAQKAQLTLTLTNMKDRLDVVKQAVDSNSQYVPNSSTNTGDNGDEYTGGGYNSTSLYTKSGVQRLLPSGLSVNRKGVVNIALLYVGKIPFYWGGKATSKVHTLNNFGSTVASDDTIYNRTLKGLDCSHFVDYVFWQAIDNNFGQGNTTSIWNATTSINESDLLPGDLGFLCDPYNDCTSKGNHVGIYAGIDSEGKKIWIHEAGHPTNNVVINNYNFTKFRRVSELSSW